MKKLFNILSYLFVGLLLVTAVSFAGTLTPPGSPSKTMKSLSDLYELVNTGANTPTTDFTTPGAVSATMHSLGDTYDLLKTKITAIDATKILTGTSIFGVAGSAVPGEPVSPTWAAADITAYNCSWFTSMVDTTEDPSPTPAQICGDNDGCSWNAGTSECDGGTQTDQTHITWYAGEAACANSTEGGQIAGTWRLPTVKELFNHYQDNNIGGNPPAGFQADYYWSNTIPPIYDNSAYLVYMYDGGAGSDLKHNLITLTHCAR